MLPESISGHRVGWFPREGLVFAEGHPDPDGLCAPARLPEALEGIYGAMADFGIRLPRQRTEHRFDPKTPTARRQGFAGIRRLDLTADLAFDHPGEGLAVLAGIAAIPIPRVQTAIRRQVGGRAVETVAMFGRGGKQQLARWYDKGQEAGTAERGVLIRPEDQRRFKGRARPPVEAITATSARALFQGRFLPLWKATKGITVATAPEVFIRLEQLRASGELTGRQAAALGSYLAADQFGYGEAWFSRATAYRRRSDLREHGVVLADGVVDEVEVDLHGAIEAALEAEDWYAE